MHALHWLEYRLDVVISDVLFALGFRDASAGFFANAILHWRKFSGR